MFFVVDLDGSNNRKHCELIVAHEAQIQTIFPGCNSVYTFNILLEAQIINILSPLKSEFLKLLFVNTNTRARNTKNPSLRE